MHSARLGRKDDGRCLVVCGEGVAEFLISGVSDIYLFLTLTSLKSALAMLFVDQVEEHLVVPDEAEVLEGRVEGESGSLQYSGAQGRVALASVHMGNFAH